MAKISKTIVDKNLRDLVFSVLFDKDYEEQEEYTFTKINDRQYGILLVDANGETRYVRLGAIVAELRDDMTAEELMNSEIAAYQQKQAEKAEKAKKKEEKIAKDKAKREAEKEKEKEKEGE